MAALFADFFVSLFCLLFIAAIVLLLYKKRHEIKKFATNPDYGKQWRPSRETILKRDIEDAEAELEYLAGQKEKEKEV